jgi:hypothetical protein
MKTIANLCGPCHGSGYQFAITYGRIWDGVVKVADFGRQLEHRDKYRIRCPECNGRGMDVIDVPENN